MINVDNLINKNILFLKFILVGGLNTVFGYLIYAFFIFVGLHFTIAVLFSTIAGILFNFKTTGCLVFKNYDNKLIFKFLGVYVIMYFLNIGFLKVLKELNVNLYIGGLTLLLPMGLISFILMKYFVFSKKGIKS